MPNPKITRVVAGFDLHYPKAHKPTFNAMLQYIADIKPQTYVFGGDQLDLECISHHTHGMPLYRTRRAYANDIDGFAKEILKPLEDALPKGATKVWIVGNHERFEHDLIERHPELDGTVDHIRNLQLVERGWQIVPLGHSYKVGKLTIVHGEVLSGIGNQAGTYPSKKAVELYSGNVLAGHTHAPQSFTKISPVEQSNKWQGWIAPILGAVNPSYLRNRPTAWLTGFVDINVLPNGQFNLFPIICLNGQFAMGGKLYGA